MKALGLTYVRVGEFAWSRFEPAPGHYDFGWFDDALDILTDAGLKVVIGTPTATPPKWLVDRHPDMLAVDPQTGRTRGFGSRRHYDFSSEAYLEACRGIVTALAERYGQHPGVVGWQTDNELCCHDTTLSASPVARDAFRVWLKARYGDVATLNAAWGNVFWSMEYRSFDEIELPVGAVTETSPAHRMATVLVRPGGALPPGPAGHPAAKVAGPVHHPQLHPDERDRRGQSRPGHRSRLREL